MPDKKRILCVDDDHDDVFLFTETVHDLAPAMEVMHAGNGKEAIDLLRDAQANGVLPCLVVLDINMPVMDGKETLEHLQMDVLLNSVPVVVFTSSQNINDKIYFSGKGVSLVRKPDNYQYLKQAVQSFISPCINS